MSELLTSFAFEVGVARLGGQFRFTDDELRQFAAMVADHCAAEIWRLAQECERDGFDDSPRRLAKEMGVLLTSLFD